ISKGWSVEYRLPSADEIEEDTSFIGDVLAYMNSPEGELFLEVGEIVSDVLERANVDAKERQIIWEDGERLSIAASAQRLGVEHPEYPLGIIEQNVVIWLESEFAPPTYYTGAVRRTRSTHPGLDSGPQAASEESREKVKNSPLLSKHRYVPYGVVHVKTNEPAVEHIVIELLHHHPLTCLLYTSPSPRDGLLSRMPSSA